MKRYLLKLSVSLFHFWGFSFMFLFMLSSISKGNWSNFTINILFCIGNAYWFLRTIGEVE